MSYNLAEVFVQLLLDKKGDFIGFLQNAAASEDAGHTTAYNFIGCGLDELASTFLGEGDWRPQLKAIKLCWEKQNPERESLDVGEQP